VNSVSRKDAKPQGKEKAFLIFGFSFASLREYVLAA
jgi:hypothetical protein